MLSDEQNKFVKVDIQNTSKKFYIPSLDGMRAIAILLVFVAHIGLDHIVPGGLGVTIFFFLSGYLITTLLRREHLRDGTINFKRFFMRRILRILPSAYVVLILAVLITLLITPNREFTFQHLTAFLSQFLLFSNYYVIFFSNDWFALGSNVYWSLAVESHFYLLFPFLYLLLLRIGLKPRKQFAIFLGICLLILLWRCALFFGLAVDSNHIYYATDTRLDSILFGCALAVYGNPMIDEKEQLSESTLKYFAVPLGITLIFCSLIYRFDGFRDTLRYTVQGIALYPIFISAIRFPQWWLFKPLNWNWVRFAGMLSYPFYLTHFTVILVLDIMFPEAGLLTLGIVSLLVSTILAYAVHKIIEIPVNNLKRKFLHC